MDRPSADPSSAAVDLVVRGLVQAGRASAMEQGALLVTRVLDGVPSSSAWDPAVVEAGRLAAEADIRSLAEVLDPGVGVLEVVAPAVHLAHARLCARSDLPITTLLDVYHTAHEWWWCFASERLAAQTDDAAVLAAALDRVRAATFSYLREITRQAIRAYNAEAEEMQTSGEAARRAALGSLLGKGPVDTASVATRLGLELDQHHLVIVLWPRRPMPGADVVPALERLALEAGARLGVPRPLVSTLELQSVVAVLSRWREPGEPDLSEGMEQLEELTDGLRLASGGEGRGVAGLRGSFQEAQAAREFADLDAEGPGVTAYARVELASLLSADPGRARVFVRRQLDGLAAEDPGARRLRDTLETYLRLGSNATRTAETMAVHKNTVTYRLKQAESERGLPLNDHPLELACALQLARVLPELLEA